MEALTINEIKKAVEQENAKEKRSAWGRGVGVYALEMVDALEEWQQWNDGEAIPTEREQLKNALLNGAQDWAQFSWGGSSLIYNYDIAKRLCNNTELKLTREGDREPNAREGWLDVQARALRQAFTRVYRAIKFYNV